jgi:hypothetical protein
MEKHTKYTRNWNEVKRIIVPNGYSNDGEADCVRTCGEGLEESGNPKTQVQRANLGYPHNLASQKLDISEQVNFIRVKFTARANNVNVAATLTPD